MADVCPICGKEFEGPRFNSWPLATERCCEDCYKEKVIPAKTDTMVGIRRANSTRKDELEKKYSLPPRF